MTTTRAEPQAEQVDAYVRESARLVDEQIAALIDDQIDDAWMAGAIRYSLGWADTSLAPISPERRRPGGKRLRPALALLAYQGARDSQGTGGDPSAAVPFAAAVELVHDFSLIHDDIEDGDRTRRGQATLWSLWGQPQAINVGDAIHALAYICLGQHDTSGEIVAALSKAVVDMSIGQRRDMAYETETEISMEQYLQMIEGKTAALIACSTFGGGLLALGSSDPATRPRLAGYREFGRQLGLGFQIRDDILGIWGDEAATGKSRDGDIRRRKKSFPVVFALEASAPEAVACLRRLYQAEAEMTTGDENEVRQILDDCHAAEVAQSRVERHAELAKRALAEAAGSADAVRHNRHFTTLEQLTGRLTSRIR